MILDYINIFIFFVFGFVVALALYCLSYFLIIRTADLEKLSAYECGFDPFEDTRSKFDVRFYLVAILFIIFDLEIMFLFPWVLALNQMDLFGFLSMMFFLFLLGVGFAYEWSRGALEWE